MTKMEVFNLFSNNLGGPLPAVVGKFASLKELDLEFNNFTGPVVIEEYVALSNLEQYLVGRNELTGSLPGAIVNWTKLKTLSLGLNKLDGPVPPGIGNLTNLGKTPKEVA
jgi:Leucine-rich repeat (LRR) protein